MDRKKIYLTLEEYERNIIFTALNEMRNAMDSETIERREDFDPVCVYGKVPS